MNAMPRYASAAGVDSRPETIGHQNSSPAAIRIACSMFSAQPVRSAQS